MEMRARRALTPAVLVVAFLLLAGWASVPAHAASVDPEVVAESVIEDGYYVDSDASYLKSDAELDALREALQKAGRAGVIVLPAGTSSGPVVSRLLQSPNHKATYVILTGDRLGAVSNNLPEATVSRLLTKARTASGAKAQVLTFLDLISPRRRPTTTPTHGRSHHTTASSHVGTESAGARPGPTSTPVAAHTTDSGGNGLLYGIVGVAAAAVVISGLILWRRHARSSTPRGPMPGVR